MNDKVLAFFQNKSPTQAPPPKKMTSTTQKLLNQLLFEFNVFSKSVNEHLNTIDDKLKTQSQDIAELKELIIKKQIKKPRTTAASKQTILELLADKPPPTPELAISHVINNINVTQDDLNIVYRENIIFAITKIIEKHTPPQIFVPQQIKPYTICIFNNTDTKWKIATQNELLSIFKTLQNKFRILYLQSMTKRSTNNIFSATQAADDDDDDNTSAISSDNETHIDDILKKEEELNTDFVKMSKINGYKLKDDKIVAEFKKQLLQIYSHA